VRAFASGEELFAYGLTAECDCIVADVHLPGIDGLELHQQLVDKKMDVPLIFITSQDDVSVRSAAYKAGAMAFFHKPVDEQALIDSIEFAMEKRSQQTS